MAEATERWADRQLTKTKDGWTAVRAWDVIDCDDEFQAVSVVGVVRGQGHPLSSAMTCKQIDSTAVSPTFYSVRATYSSQTDGDTGGGGAESAATIHWETVTNSEPVDRDADGNPITNSALDPFDPPLTRDFNDKVLVVTRAEPFYDPIAKGVWENTVNNGPVTFMGIAFPAESLRCLSIQPGREYSDADTSVLVEYRFLYRRDLQKARVLDQGFGAWFTSNNTQTKGELYTGQGTQVTKPKLLNGKGKPLDVTLKVERKYDPVELGASPVGAEVEANASAAWLLWRLYKRTDFTRIGL